MGGIRKFMPITFACMLISTLAISGIPLFSGFYSKDMIVLQAFQRTLESFDGPSFFAAVALPLAALLTAFYMFRLIFMTFFGEYRGSPAGHGHGHDDHGDAGHDAHGAHDDGHDSGDSHGHHGGLPHESPWPMTVALMILATLGLFGGDLWLGHPISALAFWQSHTTWFQNLVSIESLYGGALAAPHIDHHIEHTAHILAVTVSLSVALGGVALAWFMYGRGWERSQRLAGRVTGTLGEVYTTVANKYYVDEVVNATVIRGTMVLSKVQRVFDEQVVDGIVLGVGRIGKVLAFLSAWIDRHIVDGLVNGVAATTQTFGTVTRLLQTGRVQQYVAFAVGGTLIAAAWLILS